MPTIGKAKSGKGGKTKPKAKQKPPGKNGIRTHRGWKHCTPTTSSSQSLVMVPRQPNSKTVTPVAKSGCAHLGGSRVDHPTDTVLVPQDGGGDMSVVSQSVMGSDEAWYFSKKANEARISKTHELRKFVKKELFPKWKFFTNKSQLMWTTNPKSICQFVCKSMHLRPQFKEKWWHLNQDCVMKELNRKRSDVASAMKKSFIGK